MRIAAMKTVPTRPESGVPVKARVLEFAAESSIFHGGIGPANGTDMAMYWVVGGEYEDTRFARIVGGGTEERAGPFATIDQAKSVWRAKSIADVDNCNVRNHIEKDGGTEYWVVGASYKDTRFHDTADGRPEERLGPFATLDQAKAAWHAKAMATVDDALARYRIESA